MKTIIWYFKNTTLTYQQISDLTDIKMWKVAKTIKDEFSKSEILIRKSKNYSKSKIGDKNSMTGRVRELHPNYKGEVSDGKGYTLILKPSWYTGRKGSKHIFQHHAIICVKLGLTCIPKGYCVHHINEIKTDNSPDNLVLMTTKAHAKLHQNFDKEIADLFITRY